MDFTYSLLYISGSLVFLAVLICGEYLFSLNYKRRERFALRFFVSNAIVFVVSIPLTLGYYVIDNIYNNIIYTNISTLILYLVMFAGTIVAMKFYYRESLASCLLSGVASFSCQHINYGIYYGISISTQLELNLFSSLDFCAAFVLSLLVQLACAAATLTVLYFLFAKKTNKISPDNIVKKNLFFITSSTLMIVLILNAISNIYAGDSLASAIVSKMLLASCCVFMLMFYKNILESGAAKNDLDIVTNLNMQERRHFEKLKETMELINIKCHDIKHYIERSDKRKGTDTAELNELVQIYDSTIKTGNDIIDTLLAERNLYCSAHNIGMAVIADASQLDFISVTDMCSLFGNMLENAVEAVREIEDESKRTINITIRPIAGQIFLCIENPYAVEPVMRDGALVSVKDDRNNHGFGMKSIKMIVEKYDGTMTVGTNDGIFRVSILFPVKA